MYPVTLKCKEKKISPIEFVEGEWGEEKTGMLKARRVSFELKKMLVGLF